MSAVTSNQGTDLSRRMESAAFALLVGLLALLPLAIYIGSHDQFELPKQLLLRAGSALALAAWLASLALSPKTRWRRSPLDLPILLWSLWLLFKTFHSVSRPLSWRGEYENFNGSLTQLNYSLLYLLAVQLINGPGRAAWLLRAFERSAVAVAVYALFQAVQLDFIQWAKTSIISDRFFSTLGNPNFLAGMMVMALPLLAARAWEAWQQGRPVQRAELWLDWACRLVGLALWIGLYKSFPIARDLDLFSPRAGADAVAGLLLLASAAALLLQPLLWRTGRTREAALLGLSVDALLLFKALANTGTRGAFLGLAAAALVLLAAAWQQRRSRSFRWLLALGLGLSLLALGPVMRERLFKTLRDPGHAIEVSRRQIWVPALRIWRDHPLTGSGVDSFKTVFPHYSTARFAAYDGDNVSSRNAHSEPLQVLATLGAIGLSLWLFLLLRGAWAWRRAWSAASGTWKLDLTASGAAAAAYLGQNLVSFGVAGIAAPFFVWLALPGTPSAGAKPAERALPAWSRSGLLLLAAAWAYLGPHSAWINLRADVLYQDASSAQQQVQVMDQAGLDQARALAAYALQGITQQGLNDPVLGSEVNRWYERLRSAEQRLALAEPATALRADFVQGAQYLLLALSTLQQEAASTLRTDEVKYKVYAGLAWEELYRRTADPINRQEFFQRALQAYGEGSAMNPLNAYYLGNVARMQGLRVEAGDVSALPLAEAAYLAAIERAPVTRLFYENLVLLYLKARKPDSVPPLVERAWARDPDLGASVAFSAGSALYDAHVVAGKPYDAATTKRLRAEGQALLRRAYAQRPGESNIPYVLGVMLWNDGKKVEARAMLDAALKLEPGHKATLGFKNMVGIK